MTYPPPGFVRAETVVEDGPTRTILAALRFERTPRVNPSRPLTVRAACGHRSPWEMTTWPEVSRSSIGATDHPPQRRATRLLHRLSAVLRPSGEYAEGCLSRSRWSQQRPPQPPAERHERAAPIRSS